MRNEEQIYRSEFHGAASFLHQGRRRLLHEVCWTRRWIYICIHSFILYIHFVLLIFHGFSQSINQSIILFFFRFHSLRPFPLLTRQMCGPARPFDMRVLDNYEREVMHFYRPFKCGPCSWCGGCCQQVRSIYFSATH